MHPGRQRWGLIIGVVLLGGLMAGAASAADPKYVESQERADRLYAEKSYSRAYRTYRDLARVGDSFAQYRVSYMLRHGQGTRTDATEAYAWSVLASQNDNPQLIEWREALYQDLPEAQREPALEQAQELMDRYGNLALAEEARRAALKRLRSCTGSRTGARCEALLITNAPVGSGIAPGGANAGEPGGASRVNIAAESAREGSPDPQFVEMQKLREAHRRIEQYIAERTGNVELGELELIDEPEG